ncbi:MAG: D-alanine--D-alanine ligase [Alphaproteobacteria bacterium]|nr:D-alanine--D-alanine ligase [Alphaproteobacteria bacterium]
MKVMVLAGGTSSEREVSLESGKGVLSAVGELGHVGFLYDLTEDISELIYVLNQEKPDVVFNALHGRYGEDGNIQGLLNLLKIRYTHSGVLSSALAMDKRLAKIHLRNAGIPVAKDRLVNFHQLKEEQSFPYPYVIKPVNEGSSVGVFIIESKDDKELLLQSWPFGGAFVMMEEYIAGRELSVAVMGDQVLGIVELVPKAGFYNYANKYTDGCTEHLIPAPLPPEYAQKISHYALKAHQALGCKGVSRTDFRYDDLNKKKEPRIVALELNNQPGMTKLSLVPEIAKSVGISYKDVVSFLIEEATWES